MWWLRERMRQGRGGRTCFFHILWPRVLCGTQSPQGKGEAFWMSSDF